MDEVISSLNEWDRIEAAHTAARNGNKIIMYAI